MPRQPKSLLLAALITLTPLALTLTGGGSPVTAQAGSPRLDALARQAVDPDPARSAAATQALRARGPAGLAALLREHSAAIEGLRDAPRVPSTAGDERLRSAVDAVSGQRDGHASGLFFHTDLPEALAEAGRRGVPVLSFRMLGRLDEELSCANSRYFRTIVYSDPSVSTLLRQRFVLHVSTERPAPRITIDMGDGRTMVRTITGNSVHYVLDGEGRVIDALPGLYAPPQFVQALDASQRMVSRCGGLHGARFEQCVTQVHGDALTRLETGWRALRAEFGALPTWDELRQRPAPLVGPGAPSAREAMAATMSKLLVEAPMLDAIAQRPTPQPYEGLNWPAVVRLGEFGLSPRSLALVRLKSGRSDVSRLALELARNAMADGLRNEFVLHARIHDWLAANPTRTDFAAVNTWVYAEVFLTPAGDPWLGLRADDVWDAIEETR